MPEVALNTSFIPYLKQDEKQAIFQAIYEEFRRQGYSTQEIADLFDLSVSAIYKFLNGEKTPADDTLDRLLRLASEKTVKNILEKIVIPALNHALKEAEESLHAVEQETVAIENELKALLSTLEGLGFKTSMTESEGTIVISISINDVHYMISKQSNMLTFNVSFINQNVFSLTQTETNEGVFIDYDDKRNVKVEKKLTISDIITIISTYKDDYKSVIRSVLQFYGLSGEFAEKEVVAEINEKEGIYDYIVTKDYQLIDTAELTKGIAHGTEKTTITVNNIQYVVKVEANDEDNYKIRKVFVPESAVLAIVRVQKAEKGLEVKIVYGEGNIETKEEEVVEQAPGKFSAKRKYKRWYYVYENHRILIAQQELSIEKMLNPEAKVDIYAKYERGVLSLFGEETYFVRDKIKALGFHWNSVDKAWEKRVSKDEAINLIKKVEEFANIGWKGKPLVKTEKEETQKREEEKTSKIAQTQHISLDTLLSKLNENMEYIEITPDLKDIQIQIEHEIQNWQKSYFFKYTTGEQGGDYVLYKNAPFYVLSDLVNSYMYIIRDEKSLIESFLNSFDNFIMKGIASKVGALTVVNRQESDAVRYCDIPRKAIEALEEELLEPVQYGFWTTFSFNDFKTELPVNWSRGCFYIKKDEISIALKEFMISNYKQLGALMIDEKGEIEFVSPAILTRLKSDKRFTELKLNTAFAKATLKEIEGKWQKKSYILGIFTMYISPDERYYALTDAEAGVVYILRDQEHMIADFMDSFEKFIMQDLKEELGAKEVAKEVNYIYYPGTSEEMIKTVIELEQSDFSYTTSFKFDDFYGSVRVGYCPAVHTLCVTKSNLSETVRDFIYHKYRKWWENEQS